MHGLTDLLAATPGTSALLGWVASNGLALCFGGLVGFSLGLTGGGGSIFAVPLLVYGLHVPPNEAAGISLAAVGTTSLAGAIHRLAARQVEVGTGLVFAATGMLGAPVGLWIGSKIPGALLLLMFAGLMLVVAARMWRSASKPRPALPPGGVAPPPAPWTGPRLLLLGTVGLASGVLSGLFGVGGGFIIVPALVFVAGLAIHRAVATSLMVIALVGASGVVSLLLSGRPLPLDLTTLFVAGGVAGLTLGTILGKRVSGPALQKVFAVAMVLVAAYIVARRVTSI